MDNILTIDGVINNDNPTIGLLTEDLSGEYMAGVWPAIVDTAKKEQVNLICFCGGSLGVSSQDEWFSQGNVLFDIAQKNGLDGVIVTGSLASYCDDETEIMRFIERFSSIPVISLAPTVADIPAVFVDNKSGMRSLMEHVVKEHSYKKVAFIRGPEGNVEAEERFSIFQDVMSENGIPIDEELCIFGDFTRASGAKAAKKLYDSNNLPEIIISADDETALGAMDYLRKKGVQIPQEVALVGFDNIDEGEYVTPTLTTVSQPLYEIGRSIVENLVKKIKGEDVSGDIVYKAPLVVRESCGCFNYAVNYEDTSVSFPDASSDLLKLDSEDCLRHVTMSKGGLKKSEKQELVNAFCNDINSEKGTLFLKIVSQKGYRYLISGYKLAAWRKILTDLWDYSLRVLDKKIFSFAGTLIHRARLILSEMEMREQGRLRLEDKRDNFFLHETGDEMRNALGIDDLMTEVCDQIPELDIDTFYLALYEKTGMASKKSRLMVAVNDGEKIEIDSKGIRFSTQSLLPADVIKSSETQVLVVEPLYFQADQYGYIILEAVEQEYEVYDILREYISGALHSSNLMKKVETQSEHLSAAYKELEGLREKEKAYLDAVKGELELGQKIQAGFLPETLPEPDGWGLSIHFKPAREVSGDFYDAFWIDDDKLMFLVADVSGKDVSAALFMALIRTLIRVFAERANSEGEDPLSAIEVVNNYIIQHHRQSDGRCMFATIIIGVLNPNTGEINYINAGHNPPVILSKNGIRAKLPPTGPAVGLAGGMKFGLSRVNLEHGEMIFAYTDGVTEAQDANGEFYSTERLEELLVAKPVGTAKEKIDEVREELEEFVKGLTPFDDITMFTIKRD